MLLTETRICVIDTETTGLDPGADRIVEVGLCPVTYDPSRRRFIAEFTRANSSLCNPGRDIPPVAKAVHHITEPMVADAFPAEQVLETVGYGFDCFAAHNAEFDRGMCATAFFQPERWLCTMRLAMHLWPDAPAYGNEVLRYWLGYDRLPFQGEVHRAGYDAKVTALLLVHMLTELGDRFGTVEEVSAWAEEPVLLKGQLGFGKHAELTWGEVARKDPGYLRWMLSKPESEWDRDRWFTAKQMLDVLL